MLPKGVLLPQNSVTQGGTHDTRQHIGIYTSCSWQASSEDLFPLGYGEWERTKVRVKFVFPSL
jgi:hypothetical protein